MLKLPEKYKNREILYRRLILFTFGLGLIVVYIPQIIGFIGNAIWVCLPFIIGSLLAFILIVFSRVLMRFAYSVLKIEQPQKYQILFKILTLVVILGFLALLIAFIIPQLLSSLEGLASDVPSYIRQLTDRVYVWSEKVPFVRTWMDENQALLNDSASMITKAAGFVMTGAAGSGLGNIANVISNTFSWIWIIFLSVAFSFIAFFNASSFVKEGRMIVRAYLPDKVVEPLTHFVKLVSEIFTQYIGGTVLECIILATLVSVAGLIFQIPYAILVGVFCGICALVPMFGATAGAILCTLFILIESPGKAITFLIMFVIIQQIEGNFIYPNVVGKSVGLPPMFVIVSITIGASLAGILGMIVSIPIASVIYALILDKAISRTQEKKELADTHIPPQE